MAVISHVAHSVFTYIVYGLSLSTNLFLIYVVNTAADRNQIGSYRFLLTAFAITDILISTVHALLVPRVLGTSFGYIFYGQNLMGWEEAWGKYGGHVFVLFFYLTFLVLAFHYIYRARAMRGVQTLNISGNRKWIVLTTAATTTIVYCAGWIGAVEIGFLPTQLKRELYRPFLLNETGVDLLAEHKPGFLAIVFRVVDEHGVVWWQKDAIISICLALFIFNTAAVVIAVCVYRIARDLQSIPETVSANTKKMQKQLFRALKIQTAVPCIFSYLPLSVIFLFPVFGCHLGGLAGDLLIMATAIFPAVDPILIMLFVGKYRWHALSTVLRLVGQRQRFDDWRSARTKASESKPPSPNPAMTATTAC